MNLTLPLSESIGPPRADPISNLPAQIWRRRRLFALVFVLTLLPALASIVLLPPIYFAAGSVLIGNQEPASSGASAAWIEKLGDPADLESQLLIVTSHRMLRLALARPGVVDAVLQECRHRSGLGSLFGRADCSKLKPGSDLLLAHVQSRYSVGGVGRSRVISIGYRSSLPDVAFMLANALLITYLEDQRAENAGSREAASAWVLNEGNKATENRSSSTGHVQADELDVAAAQSRQKFYQDLYKKANDLESERRVLVSSGRLVTLAEVPGAPFFPKSTPILAAGLTVALILAALAALWRDITDRTVRRTGQLEALTGVAVLATMPRISGSAREAMSIRLHFLKRWQGAPKMAAAPLLATNAVLECPLIGEAAHKLYVQLLLLQRSKERRRILITSATPGESKTITALSLARACAEGGRKVLVIDCNLRSPAAAKYFGLSRPVGLADILRGEIEPEQAIIQTRFSGLDILSAGTVRGDATMLLIDGHLPRLMEWSERYDLVLLDGPAVETLPDAAILARHSDGVLWCARWGRVLQSDVKGALDDLHRQGANLLGIVVTMVRNGELRLYERPRPFSPSYMELS